MDDSSSERSPLGVLAEEFVERYRNGERPSLTEYAERAPELADEIRSLFPTLVEMEQLKPVTGDHTGHYVEPPPDLERLGEFRILRRVGVGGMGVVYEAVQESLGRHVALKVLPANALADPKRLERFRREAKAAAKLHHTNIVPVFGTGEAEGRHYYAMQFIAGHPLDAVIDEVQRLKGHGPPATRGSISQVALGLASGSFAAAKPASEAAGPPATHSGATDASAASPSSTSSLAASGSLSDGGRHYFATVARIGEQVAGALSYAHGQGILHRDIKPANLLLDLHGTVWVADFGLAKELESDDLTLAGDVVGTLRYLAPERFEGQGDHRADVCALGLTLYELLTLKPAFTAETRARLVEQVLAASPPTPRGVNPAIPRDLETIVLKAIARDPAMRYQSAAEMADDLRRYQEDRPIAARRAGQIEQAWRWCRRNPALAGLMASLLLVFGLGAGVSAFFAVQAERKEVEARQNAVAAQGLAEQAAQNATEAQQNARTATDNARQAAAREKEAIAGREQLRREQDHARRLIYAGQIYQASAALDEERIPRLRQLLEETKPKPGEPDLRGWEWHYLYRQTQPPPAKELRLQRDVEGKPAANHTEVEISADGRHLIHNRWTPEGAWFEIWDLSTFQRVGRVPETGAIPVAKFISPNVGASHPYTHAVVSPDGKFLAAAWLTAKFDNAGLEWRLRIWEVATGKEVGGPSEPIRLSSGQLRISSEARDVVWVELVTKSETPRIPPRFGGPLDIVRWTRETGKIDRKRIEPQRGEVNVSVDPACRFAVAVPGSSSRVVSPSKAPTYEAWDLSGEKPKPREGAALERTSGIEPNYAASGFTGGDSGAFAVADSKELSVFSFTKLSLLWRTSLPAEKSASAHLLGISDDGRRAVFCDSNCLWALEKAGEGTTAPARHWVIRHEGMSASITRKITADGRRVITAVAGPASNPNEVLVRVTDISRDPGELKPLPREKIVIERTGPGERPRGIQRTGPWGQPNGGPPPNLHQGFVIRDRARREFGRIPSLAQGRQQFAEALCDGRRLLVTQFTPGAFGKSDSAAFSWQLFALNGPGDMPLITSGTDKAAASSVDQRAFFYTLSREKRDGDAGVRTVVALYDSETGALIGRLEPRMTASESLQSVRIVPGAKRVLVATHPSRNKQGLIPVTLRLCDLETGEELWKTEAGQYHQSWYQCESRDGRRAVCGTRLNSGQTDVAAVRLSDGVVEQRFRVLDGDPAVSNINDAPMAQMAGLAPDGRLAIIARDEVQLWDCDTGKLSQRFQGNTFGPNNYVEAVRFSKPEAVRFSKDGRRMFVSGSKLHVWDVTTGRELMTLMVEEAIQPQFSDPGFYSFDEDMVVVKCRNGLREFNGTPVKP